MAEAEVGDDGYGEDPTVRRLEAAFAERVGKEAALYVPSGTMANQIALRLLGRPGTSVVVGRRQHVVLYEAGGAGSNGSTQFHPVDDNDGTIDPAEVRYAIDAGEGHHWPAVSAVCVENTHMAAGGVPWPADRLREVASAGLPVHLDGARLFNAEVASGVEVATLAGPATTVMCCLSKGLAAPVGSLLAGPSAVIADGRAERKRLGGAMRQAGVIAAAGLVALQSMVERLADDHDRARRLAEAVAERWPDAGDRAAGPASDGAAERATTTARATTNIVVFHHTDPAAVLAHLAAHDVLAGTIAPRTIRLVTHLDIDDLGVERAMKAIASSPI